MLSIVTPKAKIAKVVNLLKNFKSNLVESLCIEDAQVFV